MAPEPEDDIMNEKNPRPLDEDDIALLKTYVRAPTPSDPLTLSNLGLLVRARDLSRVWAPAHWENCRPYPFREFSGGGGGPSMFRGSVWDGC